MTEPACRDLLLRSQLRAAHRNLAALPHLFVANCFFNRPSKARLLVFSGHMFKPDRNQVHNGAGTFCRAKRDSLTQPLAPQPPPHKLSALMMLSHLALSKYSFQASASSTSLSASGWAACSSCRAASSIRMAPR